MARRSACLALVLSVAFAAPAYGQTESGSGTVVTITQPDSTSTQVGTSTGDVTSGSSGTPAAGVAVPIATATPVTAVASATPTPTPTAASTTTSANTTPVENSATTVSADGVVATDVKTSSQSQSPTTVTASTTNGATVGETRVELRAREQRQRAINLKVRDGRSKSSARRRARRQTTVGEVSVGSASPRAAAEEPAVDLEQRVTIDRIKVRSRSRAVGGKVTTRRTLDVRNLVVKAKDGTPILTIHRGSLTPDGHVRLHLTTGGTVDEVVIVRAGSDVLDPRSYHGPMREAIRQVQAALAADTATGQVLDSLQVRLGAGSQHDGKRRSSGKLDGVTIRIGTTATGTDARAALPGFVEAAIGHVESAAQVIEDAAVRVPDAIVTTGETVGDVAGATKTLFIRPPKLRFERPRVVLRGDELHLVLTCTAAVKGVLALELEGVDLPETTFNCQGKARLKIELSREVADELREAAPATLTATVRATTPGTVAFRAPERLRLIAG